MYKRQAFDSVREIIGQVEDIAFVDQQETYLEYIGFFPDAADTASPEDMPPSFRVSPRVSAETRASLDAHPAVRHIVEPTMPTLAEVRRELRWANDPRKDLSIIYLHATVGPEEAQLVRDIIGPSLPGVYFVDQEETYREFTFLNEGDPATPSLTVDLMPPSWRVDLDGASLPPELQAKLEANEFVRSITNAQS